MNRKIIVITTYMYSNSKKQLIPLYEDNKLNVQQALDYLYAFVQRTSLDIEHKVGLEVTSIKRIAEWSIEHKFASDDQELILYYRISLKPAPYKTEDDMRNKLSTKLFDWFVHHVDINGHSEPNWIAAECYLYKLFS